MEEIFNFFLLETWTYPEDGTSSSFVASEETKEGGPLTTVS
jgi:hypothetical protein